VTKCGKLKALSKICRSFGGELVTLSEEQYQKLFSEYRPTRWSFASPFTDWHGIDRRKKIVYTTQGHEEIRSIIHEMGHVFADRYAPDTRRCKEFRWFGWEVALARTIGAVREWSAANAHYFVGDDWGGDWGYLSAKEKRAVVTNRVAHAKKIGLVTKDGRPRSVR
jgi:hypothetical protein